MWLYRRVSSPPGSYRARQRSAVAANQDDRWHKARALWSALAHAGHVRLDTDAALMAYVSRQVKVAHWRFINTVQISDVIEAIKRWCVHVGVPANA